MNTKKANFVLLSVIVALVTGCVGTFKEVKPLGSGLPPKDKPAILVLGRIGIKEARLSRPEREVMFLAFEQGVAKWCDKNKSLDFRRQYFSTNLPTNSILLTGVISEIEEGSPDARTWVGMGAGQQRVVGKFAINASDGTKLAAFSARKSYLGGTGIGGPDMIDIGILVERLGQLVAETTDKWVQGKKL